ncbi:MAG TPA: radical SAM protein [Thermodesulfovibrionales bacterium]|nr:radical SAM protein [Thermodesulfovibrionales bacterium]
MTYFLSSDAVLKWLEAPSVYHIKRDDLYELDEDSFRFLGECATDNGRSSGDKEFIGYCLNEGLLTENRIVSGRPPVVKAPSPSLRYLELQITDICNLRCRHCYIGAGASSELSVEQVGSVLRQFEAMQGLRIMITGGEPLMHSKFWEINEILPSFFLRKILFSNGLLLDAASLKRLHIDEIQVSIDGLEKAHEALRGSGTYKKALRAVRQAIDYGFAVSVATMVHRGNLADFSKMERLFLGLGIKDWTVDVPCPAGRMKDNADFMVTPEIGGKYLRYGYGEGLHAGLPGYACGLHLMAVMADGRISKCSFYADSPVGSVREDLRECWSRITPIRLQELTCDCDVLESCRGGCRYRAALLGNPNGKDLYKCISYDKISGKY